MSSTVLITGGAGFVGSHLGVHLKETQTNVRVIALDNLKRRGSELNLPRLQEAGIEFVHGDNRSPEDLDGLPKIDVLYDCSAEPSALSGFADSPRYIVETNLVGTLNCLELARRHGAAFIFLSTSRVYPYPRINALPFQERSTRFEIDAKSAVAGLSERGIGEAFPLEGARTLYGATKLASEVVIQEYFSMYDLPGFINRCSVLSGPWQMGKVDQGFFVFWAANHHYGKPLRYLGYEGKGKQVRDVMHIKDLCRLLDIQMTDLAKHQGEVYNVGGGPSRSISLAELTALCERATGKKTNVGSDVKERPGDVRWYVSDAAKISAATGWKPEITLEQMMQEVVGWIRQNEALLQPIFG